MLADGLTTAGDGPPASRKFWGTVGRLVLLGRLSTPKNRAVRPTPDGPAGSSGAWGGNSGVASAAEDQGSVSSEGPHWGAPAAPKPVEPHCAPVGAMYSATARPGPPR